MPLNKKRKRLVRRLKRQETKRLIMDRNWQIFEERFLETHRANIERFMNAGSPFRGGRVFDGVTWREDPR